MTTGRPVQDARHAIQWPMAADAFIDQRSLFDEAGI
jgi:hypothetical protein